MTKRCKIGDLCLITGGNLANVGQMCEVVAEPTLGTYSHGEPGFYPLTWYFCDPSRHWIISQGEGHLGLWNDCYLMPIRPDASRETERTAALPTQPPVPVT